LLLISKWFLFLNLEVISEFKDKYNRPEERFECKNCVVRNEPKALSAAYSTQVSVHMENPAKPDINLVIFNDRHAHANPTKESDFKINYLKPNKEDYRKKRNQTYYPKYDGPFLSKDHKSEYNTEFKKFS
jgi:hypothetical protein